MLTSYQVSWEPDETRMLTSYHVFEMSDLDVHGQVLIVIRNGKPTLSYREFMSHRWSPEIMPNTPNL
jgi:hypothetical protein